MHQMRCHFRYRAWTFLEQSHLYFSKKMYQMRSYIRIRIRAQYVCRDLYTAV